MELLKSEQNPRPKDWRLERVAYWRSRHKEILGSDPRLGYGAMMQMLENLWLKHHGFTDTGTGEIIFDVPPIEDWKSETDWFFRDKWAGENCGYFFGYFIQRYGSFTKYTVKEQVKEIPKRRLMIACSACGKNHYTDENCYSSLEKK